MSIVDMCTRTEESTQRRRNHLARPNDCSVSIPGTSDESGRAAQLASMPMDKTITSNRLACYVSGLRDFDDKFRLRVILHDFGMVWQHADRRERGVLVEEEPEPFDERWDAFLAAYVEHLCYHAEMVAPAWTQHERRYLKRMWWPAHYFEFERGSVMMSTPVAFEVHGMWIAERELEVV